MWRILVGCLAVLAMCAHAQDMTSALIPVATCDMKPNRRLTKDDPLYEDIYGTVIFSQTLDGAWVELRVNLRGFDTTDADRRHGFHIHTYGNISKGCEPSGPHFNPLNSRHGGPGSVERHVGDLGNVIEDDDGNVIFKLLDDVIKFEGIANVAGRTLDIHETVDDLLPTGNGNDGPRLACCIITLLPPMGIAAAPPLVSSIVTSSMMAILGLLLASMY